MKIKNWKKMVAMTMTAAVLSSGSLMMEMPKAEAGMDWGKIAGEVFGAAVEIGKSKNSSSSKPTADQLATLGYQKHARKDMTNNEKLFMLAVIRGDVENATAMLNAGVDVNGVYNYGEAGSRGTTALYAAINRHDRAMQQLLLENGADVTGFYLYDNKYCSYLVVAAASDNLELMQYLHNWGAPINSVGTKNNFANDYIYNAISTLSTKTYFYNENIFEYLLKEGIDVDYKNPENGRTPFLDAVYYGNRPLVRLLASYGANLNAVDSQGRNATDIALANNDLDMYKVVQEINTRGQQPSHKK